MTFSLNEKKLPNVHWLILHDTDCTKLKQQRKCKYKIEKQKYYIL